MPPRLNPRLANPRLVPRTYTTASPTPPSYTPPLAAQTAFLRHRDQHLLRETLDATAALTAHCQKIVHHLRTHHPIAIAPPPGSNLKNPYILGRQRIRLDIDLARAEERVLRSCAQVSEHLTDLMFEPYPYDISGGGDRATNPHLVFEASVARMAHADRREQLASVRLEEEAVAGRMTRDIEAVRRIVDEYRGRSAGLRGGESGGERVSRPRFARAGNGSWGAARRGRFAAGASWEAARVQAQAKAGEAGVYRPFGAQPGALEVTYNPAEVTARPAEVIEAPPPPPPPRATFAALRKQLEIESAEPGASQADAAQATETLIKSTETEAKPAEARDAAPPPPRMSLAARQKQLELGPRAVETAQANALEPRADSAPAPAPPTSKLASLAALQRQMEQILRSGGGG
ncbi:hypothetical protein LTR08_008526 [Meristemomyces frigidus]|nr:hypothetical protein LTR08_008526 [Meristemomyces frigidus]